MCWEVSEPCVIKWIASVGSQGAVFSNWSLKTRSRSGFPSQAKAPQTCLVESIDAHCISVVHRCSLFLLPKPLQTGNLWGRLSILPLTFVSFMKSKSVVSSMIIHHYRKLCKQNWIYIYIHYCVFMCIYMQNYTFMYAKGWSDLVLKRFVWLFARKLKQKRREMLFLPRCRRRA